MSGGRLGILVALTVGVAAGAGAFTFVYAEGGSYLTDDPSACGNCHVMGDHLKAWERGSHRSAAGCNDCHAPHDSFVGRYAVKAINGFNHSLAFTTGDYPTNLAITPLNRRVTESACRHCHAAVVSTIEAAAQDHAGGGTDSLACIRCHGEVGHP